VSRPGRLQDKACLIVGGTSGIGLAAARRFLGEGARVVVAGLAPEAGAAAHEALAPLGTVWNLVADVKSHTEVKELFDQALGLLGGRLDVLFHVAGISGRKFGDGPLHECTDDAWDRVLETNAQGAFLTNREAARWMLDQPLDGHGLRGTVLNMGSVLAESPVPAHFGTIAYAASKGAVRSMTRAAAARYAPDRIRFNLIAPGLIETPMAERAMRDPEVRRYLAAKQPMAAGPGSAADCAEAALYLCEPASRFVTGVELVVDGGWSISEGRLPHG